MHKITERHIYDACTAQRHAQRLFVSMNCRRASYIAALEDHAKYQDYRSARELHEAHDLYNRAASDLELHARIARYVMGIDE